MKRLSALVTLVALAAVLSACGQKGPLYLPDAEQQPAAESAR
jgi:predicted small lipoprotein YifL